MRGHEGRLGMTGDRIPAGLDQLGCWAALAIPTVLVTLFILTLILEATP